MKQQFGNKFKFLILTNCCENCSTVKNQVNIMNISRRQQKMLHQLSSWLMLPNFVVENYGKTG